LIEINAKNSPKIFCLTGFGGLPLSLSIAPIFKRGISKIYKSTYGLDKIQVIIHKADELYPSAYLITLLVGKEKAQSNW
jgi:hypothetical protein